MSTDQERDISAEVYSLAKQGGIALAERIVKAREILLELDKLNGCAHTKAALAALEGNEPA